MAQSFFSSSGVTSTSGPTSAMPALLTMMSRPPSALAVWSTAANTWSRSLTSATNVVALEPISATSSATAAMPSAVTSTNATSAPSRASLSAIPRPIPRPAPVTRATFPLSPISVRSVRVDENFHLGAGVQRLESLVDDVVERDAGHPAGGVVAAVGHQRDHRFEVRPGVAERALDAGLVHHQIEKRCLERL